YAVTLLARASIDGNSVVQPVSVRGAVSTGLSGLPYPPLHLNQEVALAVKEPAPFALAIAMEPEEAVPGLPTQLKIVATRSPGFVEDIALGALNGLPANVPAPKLANIAKGKNEVKVALDVNAKTPLGEYSVFLSGRAKAM